MVRNNQSFENKGKDPCDQMKEYAQRTYESAVNPENLGNNLQGAAVSFGVEQLFEAVKHVIENPPDFLT